VNVDYGRERGNNNRKSNISEGTSPGSSFSGWIIMAGSSAPAAADSKDDDQYIAQLLAKDAQDCSLRYSAFGMYAPAAKR
jgi:hypothetical protein